MPTDRTSQQSRQLPGLACEECRKRKLRCDRQRPQCRLCNELGIVCELNLARPPRGPKKGYSRNPQTKKSTTSTNSSGQAQDASSSESSVQTDGDDNSMGSDSRDGPESIQLPHISRLMQAELHHLYFDRIHALVPMLQQQYYCTWATLDTKSEAQQCLQYAMWTLATTVTKQFDSISDSLYNATKTLANRLENKNRQLSNLPIELAQIWVLLTVYGFMQRDYQQGWMSAGHTFRLVQLMRLHEIDRPLGIGSCRMSSSTSILSTSSASYSSVSSDLSPLGYSPGWVQKEEMRRTFWMAYCLDRFPSMCNNLPLTFNEQTICCRLPMPEEAFQNNLLVVECFHSEGLTLTGAAAANLSYMSQFILLATACGRTIAHGQQSAVEQMYGDTLQGFMDRHEWLDTLLSQRLQAISTISRPRDPLFLFSHMMAQCTVLKLYKVLQSKSSSVHDPDSKMLLTYQQRAIAAADKIVSYAAHLDQFNLFKVHPFTPFTIYLCADFFLDNISIDPVFETHFLEMTQVLGDLASMNHLAEYCTDLLTSERAMSELMPWVTDKSDGIDIMDSVEFLGMDDCQFTTEDIKAFQAFTSSLK